MSARLRHVWIVVLLCILPVQSLAAALVPLTCAPHGSTDAATVDHAAVHAHAGAAHDHAALHDGTNDGHDHANDGYGHLCCHQLSSAAPPLLVIAAPQDFRVYASTVSPFAALHVPELPQRPPRV